jgi:hypothetical protein
MTTKEAREGVIARLTDTMKKHGFEFAKSRDRFEGAKADGFRAMFLFHFVNLGTGAEIQPQAGLRSDQIENLVNQARDPDARRASHSATIGNEIGYLTGEGQRWRVRVMQEQDLDSGATLIRQAFEERALPFYREYSNLAAIDKNINSDPEKAAVLCPAYMHRAQVSVAVARLVHRPDLAAVVESYRSEMHKDDVADFDRFVARLETSPPTK